MLLPAELTYSTSCRRSSLFLACIPVSLSLRCTTVSPNSKAHSSRLPGGKCGAGRNTAFVRIRPGGNCQCCFCGRTTRERFPCPFLRGRQHHGHFHNTSSCLHIYMGLRIYWSGIHCRNYSLRVSYPLLHQNCALQNLSICISWQGYRQELSFVSFRFLLPTSAQQMTLEDEVACKWLLWLWVMIFLRLCVETSKMRMSGALAGPPISGIIKQNNSTFQTVAIYAGKQINLAILWALKKLCNRDDYTRIRCCNACKQILCNQANCDW